MKFQIDLRRRQHKTATHIQWDNIERYKERIAGKKA